MASRWRVWDLEFKDTLPNISNQIYQEPIRIEQSQTYPSHYLPDCLIELVVSEANRRCVLECESESSVGYKNEYDTDVKSQDTDTLNHSDNYSDTMSCTSLIGEVSLTCLTNFKKQISFSCPDLSLSVHPPSNHIMEGVKTERIEKGKGRATLLKQRAIKALALNKQTMIKQKPVGRGRAKIRTVK